MTKKQRRTVRIALDVDSGNGLERVGVYSIAEMRAQNQDQPDVERAIERLARNRVDTVLLGGGAAPVFSLTRVVEP